MNEKYYFTKKERISWVVMIIIIAISIYTPNIFTPASPQVENPPFSHSQIDSIIQKAESSKTYFDKKSKNIKQKKNSKSDWQKQFARSKPKKLYHKNMSKLLQFNFDPNLTSEDSIKLLFSRYVAQNIIKYRSLGGSFQQKEDLLKIYGMDTSRYQVLQPFIHFKKVENPVVFNRAQQTFHSQQMIALNEADTTLLIQLRGIGSVLAHRIVAFRNALGGFYTIDQLKETYGLPEETFQIIRPFLKLGKPHQKIALNTMDQKTLSAHPYISWKQAKWIDQYRKQHGPFASVTDLYQIRMLDSSFVSKLNPYLEFAQLLHPEKVLKLNSVSQ